MIIADSHEEADDEKSEFQEIRTIILIIRILSDIAFLEIGPIGMERRYSRQHRNRRKTGEPGSRLPLVPLR